MPLPREAHAAKERRRRAEKRQAGLRPLTAYVPAELVALVDRIRSEQGLTNRTQAIEHILRDYSAITERQK